MESQGYTDFAVITQRSRVSHWSAPTLVGVLFTWGWLWLLALAVTFAPPWEWLPLEVELEAPPPVVEARPPAPPPKPRVVTPPQPKLLAQAAPAVPVEPVLPPQPEVASPEPVPLQASPLPVEAPVERAATIEAAPEAPLRIEPLSRLTRAPGFVNKVEPVYPPVAAGDVRVDVRITVDDTGAVRDVEIVTSGGAAFDAAVIAAVRRSTFVPGYIGEQAVATRFNQRYWFREK